MSKEKAGLVNDSVRQFDPLYSISEILCTNLGQRQAHRQIAQSHKHFCRETPPLRLGKDYHAERLKAPLKSWPELKSTELRKITKTDCLNWAARFGQRASPTAFNHAVSILRHVLEIGVATGVRYKTRRGLSNASANGRRGFNCLKATSSSRSLLKSKTAAVAFQSRAPNWCASWHTAVFAKLKPILSNGKAAISPEE